MIRASRAATLLSWLLLVAPAMAQDAAETLRPGLALTLRSGEEVDHRVARFVALAVREGSSPSHFLAPGPFEARFEGMLRLAMRSRLIFSFEGRGWVRLSAGEKVLLEVEGEDLSTKASKRVRLRKGMRPLTIEYRAPDTGDARLRLYWQGREFRREPVPPELLFHAANPVLDEAMLARQGRRAVAARRCMSCHGTPSKVEAPGGFRSAAPVLSGIAKRRTPGFLAAWLANPSGIRPGARMPALLPREDAAGDRADLVAWLASLPVDGAPDAKKESTSPALVERGGALYADLGCVSCHLLAEDKKDAHDRIPLVHVDAKFPAGALAEFLSNPARDYPDTRMPDFGFEEGEARALAAFLRSKSSRSFPSPPAGDAERGAALAAQHGCGNCHHLEALPRVEVKTLDAAALGGNLGNCPPARSLPAEEQGAIQAFAKRPEALARENLAERAEDIIQELRCTSCHAYDGADELWPKLRSEVAALERPHPGPKIMQWRPSLTWLGEKLLVEWTRKRLAGEITKRPRPWLYARMPAWKSRASQLAHGLAARHGLFPGRLDEVVVDPKQAEIGGKLISRSGFGCTACHPLNGREPYAVFEFKAVDFGNVRQRLRREYYLRWMWEPQRIESDSRMPIYPDEDGLTSIEDVFEGEAALQFEAIWHYLMKVGSK